MDQRVGAFDTTQQLQAAFADVQVCRRYSHLSISTAAKICERRSRTRKARGISHTPPLMPNLWSFQVLTDFMGRQRENVIFLWASFNETIGRLFERLLPACKVSAVFAKRQNLLSSCSKSRCNIRVFQFLFCKRLAQCVRSWTPPMALCSCWSSNLTLFRSRSLFCDAVCISSESGWRAASAINCLQSGTYSIHSRVHERRSHYSLTYLTVWYVRMSEHPFALLFQKSEHDERRLEAAQTALSQSQVVCDFNLTI